MDCFLGPWPHDLAMLEHRTDGKHKTDSFLFVLWILEKGLKERKTTKHPKTKQGTAPLRAGPYWARNVVQAR